MHIENSKTPKHTTTLFDFIEITECNPRGIVCSLPKRKTEKHIEQGLRSASKAVQ